ncbi:flagellin-like protein [Clostridium algidicarnis DSM 15099]|uniref:Flagellin n=1 Tax=Clostridium algidicarnis DSM 15099 TaxID=1121295 RepID=A0A2S6G0S4_9CLOT|nr:flagellin-like protein [Clostridium algidicarnis DSM 15099]
MRELSFQSANDTNTTVDRGEIQKEVSQLTQEIHRRANTTEFNTKKLLNGDSGNKVVYGTNNNVALIDGDVLDSTAKTVNINGTNVTFNSVAGKQDDTLKNLAAAQGSGRTLTSTSGNSIGLKVTLTATPASTLGTAGDGRLLHGRKETELPLKKKS